jgi:hypothetical protein
VKVAADIIEHRRYLVLWQLLDQPEQLLALHAHELSVRRPSQAQLVIASCPPRVSPRHHRRRSMAGHHHQMATPVHLTRHHATAFLDPGRSERVEELRRTWDPLMARQIAAHVTLIYPRKSPTSPN